MGKQYRTQCPCICFACTVEPIPYNRVERGTAQCVHPNNGGALLHLNAKVLPRNSIASKYEDEMGSVYVVVAGDGFRRQPSFIVIVLFE